MAGNQEDQETTPKNDTTAAKELNKSSVLIKRVRPTSLTGKTVRIRTGHSTMYVTMNADPDDLTKIFEVFAQMAKPEHDQPDPYPQQCERAFMEAISRLVSTLLRFGVPQENIIEQLRDIQCVPGSNVQEHGNWNEGRFITSPADGIAAAMERFDGSEDR